MPDYKIEATDTATSRLHLILTPKRDSAIRYAAVLGAQGKYTVTVTVEGKTYTGDQIRAMP